MGLVRPHGIDKPKVIDGERRKDLIRAECRPGRTRRAGEDLGVGEQEGRQSQLCVGRNADIDAAQGLATRVFGGVVGGHKDRIKVSSAGAAAVVDADLASDVGATHKCARSGQSRRIDGLAHAAYISGAAVGGTLHVNVERGQVVVVHVHSRRVVEGVDPHSVVSGDYCTHRVRDREHIRSH